MGNTASGQVTPIPLSRRRLLASGLAVTTGLTPLATSGQSAVVRIRERQFRSGAGRITFREVPRGTRNPVYPPRLFGGRPDDPTVSFGGYLAGRALGPGGACRPDAPMTGCLTGTPRGPVRLDPGAPHVFTADDGNHVRLSGTPVWFGPMAMLLDKDVAAVGLEGGIFNAVRATILLVYDREGRLIGQTVNMALGSEFIALATADLSPRIAAMEFHIIAQEPAGFGITNIRFGAPEQVDLPGVRPPPPPASSLLPPKSGLLPDKGTIK